MKNQVTKKILLLLMTFSTIVLLIQSKSFAAGSFSCSASTTNLTVGQTTTFTATANGCGGSFSISTSDSSVVSIEGSISEWIENGNHSVTLRANKAGKATITLKAVDVADSSTAEEITGSRSLTITVSEPTPPPSQGNNNGASGKSGDATLKSITVAGKTYSNPSTDFTVTVDSNIKSAEITGQVNNSKATISGTGTKELVTGSNTVVLTVTAENGTKRNYSIRIRKLADETTVPNVGDTPNQTNNNDNNNGQSTNNEEPKFLRLSYLIIDDIELNPEFDPETFEYFIKIANRDSVDITAHTNIEGATIEITGDKELVDGDNEITIKLTKDEQEVVYKITASKTTEDVVIPENLDNTTGEVQAGTNSGGIIAIGVTVVVIAVRTCSTLYMEAKKRRRGSKTCDTRKWN